MCDSIRKSEALLSEADAHHLYEKLVAQISRDFERANIAIDLPPGIHSEALVIALYEKLYVLLLEKFQEYLNLLYVIDVPEKAMAEIEITDAVAVSKEVAYLILKREWQKVWFRAQMTS